MAEIQKPTTMLIDEFKEKFIQLLNDAQLPAWVVLYVLEPFIKQLQEFDATARIRDKEEYENQLKQEKDNNGAN